MDLELAGKTAIVTGGSRGIGKAVARELAREGVSVAIVARGQEALKATASELSAETHARMIPISADASSDDSVKAMVERAVAELGTVHILVNSASTVGSLVSFKLPDIQVATFNRELNVKLLGAVRCIQHVAPYMRQNGWGRII